MGWLNNFFGVPLPGADPLRHFGNAQGVPPALAPGQPQPQNFGWMPAQPPLYYAMPPQANMPPQQPVPLFRGFYGPDGVWHPWGVDPRWFGNGPHQQQPPAPAQGPAPPTNTPSSPGQSGSAPTNDHPTTQGDPAGPDMPTPTPTTNPAASTAGQPSAPTPREAVAQATLRRLGLTPPNSTTFDANASQPSTSTSTSASAPPAVPAADAPSGQGERDPSQPANGRPEAPALIPLYDLFSRPPHPASYVPYGNHHTPSFRPQATQARGPRSASQIHQSSRASGSTAPPLAQLPATLTDEQLARLDRVTREAIDERLRVLEGVSGAVHRCIEELTRVRSVLPAPAPAPAPARQHAGPAPAEERQAGEPAGSAFPARQVDGVTAASEAPAPAPPVGPAQTPAPAGSASSSAV